MRKAFLTLCFTWATLFSAPAQDFSYPSIWFTNINTFTLDGNWGGWTELHARFASNNNQMRWAQFLVRPAISYQVNGMITVSGGMTYLRNHNYTAPSDMASFAPEWNLWEQVQFQHQLGAFSFTHFYRWEHRFSGQLNTAAEQNFTYANRLRTRFIGQYDAELNEKPLQFIAFHELFFLMDLSPVQLHQQWTYLGARRPLNFGPWAIEAGYLNQWIKRGNLIEWNPTFLLTVRAGF